MQKKKVLGLVTAMVCILSALSACGNTASPAPTASPETNIIKENEKEHEAITMTAMVPFRNPSRLADLVHEKYPEINIEFVPYSGYNGSAYSRMQLEADDMPDIFMCSKFTPSKTDFGDRLVDLSAYSFTDNFTDQQLREVTSNGSIYMLPTYYSCLAITYNKTLLEKNGWELPNSLEELEALAPQVEKAGYNLAIAPVQFPGYGFQYLFNILSTGYVNTIDGRKWQNSFLAGETSFEANPELMQDLELVQRWHDVGMLNFNGNPDSDTITCQTMSEGNTLFMLGNLSSFSPEESSDEFGYMPYLSEDGTSNVYIANVTKYIGLNKHLEDAGNEQKLEDALHVMEVICTVEGMSSLTINNDADVLLPLKDFVIPEDSFYKPMENALNNGFVAPYIYFGLENMVVPVGEKVFSLMRDECTALDVAKEIDNSQHLLFDNSEQVYTTVTETLDISDCAKLVGICFAEASGADVALVSSNKWYATNEDKAMNTRGVQSPLYAMPITDEELTAMLPTGWTGTIQTVTLTGARIKELVETGYDKFEDGEHLFPYSLITPEGMTLEDTATYTVAICGASKAVQEEGNITDTGILGLDAAHTWLSQFSTLSAKDIVWE